jgi:hypothetical protein
MVGGRALADKESQTFQYLVGAGFLCNLASDACPDVAKASNGDRVEVTGQGTLVTGEDDSVTGGGTFVHKDAAGNVLATGTWTAEELVSFTSFGPDPTGALPANLVGGLAIIEVELSPAGSSQHIDAVLQVDCGINSPTGAEGVKLAVEDAVNFNLEVSGFTVFIAPS